VSLNLAHPVYVAVYDVHSKNVFYERLNW